MKPFQSIAPEELAGVTGGFLPLLAMIPSLISAVPGIIGAVKGAKGGGGGGGEGSAPRGGGGSSSGGGGAPSGGSAAAQGQAPGTIAGPDAGLARIYNNVSITP